MNSLPFPALPTRFPSLRPSGIVLSPMRAARSLVILGLLGCGDSAPDTGSPVFRSCGTLRHNVWAREILRCAGQGITTVRNEGTATLTPDVTWRSGEQRVRDNVAHTEITCSIPAATDTVTSLTLHATGYATRICHPPGESGGCSGGEALAQFLWQVDFDVPASNAPHHLTISLHGNVTTPDRPGAVEDHCLLVTPWRPPTFISLPSTVREFDVPEGHVTLQLDCSRNPLSGFVATSCYGKPVPPPPSIQVSPVWNAADLTLRLDLAL